MVSSGFCLRGGERLSKLEDRAGEGGENRPGNKYLCCRLQTHRHLDSTVRKTNSQRSQGSPFGGGLHISGHQRTIEQITSSRVLNGPLMPWEEPVYLQKVSCLLPGSRILAVMQSHPSSHIPARYLGCR